MKYSTLIILVFFGISLGEIKAQNVYDDFFLSFEVIGERLEGDKKIFKAELLNKYIIIDKNDLGSIMPLYVSGSRKKAEYIGEVRLSEDDKNTVIIELENTEENNILLMNGKALIKIRASRGKIQYQSLSYHMKRLNIKMLDVMGEKDLLEEYVIHEDTSFKGDELKILERLREESEYVAGEMREQMDSPKVNEGRFKPSDLFTAMEMADSWDVRSFLLYVKKHPHKYQGKKWKFSEIFATWIVEGAPVTFDDLRELATMNWKENIYLTRFFKDVPLEFTQRVLNKIRSEAGEEIDVDNFGKAELLIENAAILSEYINDEKEIAWTNYKKGKLLSEQGDNEAAIILYEKSIASFEKENEDAGILLAKNDLGYSYNELGGKVNSKKAIRHLEEAIAKAAKFGTENETLSPVTGLMYRNLGYSYIDLKKYKKALEVFGIGLTYTEFPTATALKRKASLLLNMSEIYEKMGDEELKESYLNQSVSTYKKYEAALVKVKNI